MGIEIKRSLKPDQNTKTYFFATWCIEGKVSLNRSLLDEAV